MKERILVVSSANVDLILNTDVIPKAGETVISKGDFAFVAGGKGANSARLCAALGCDTIFLCRLGDDRHGKRLIELYKKEGIDTRFIELDRDHPTGMAAVTVCGGESRILVYPGANTALSAESVEEAFTTYPDGALVQMEIPDRAILAAGKFAKKTGAKLVVDAGPAKPGFPFAEMGGIDVFSPNETECAAYCGIVPATMEDCSRACIELGIKMRAKSVVLKLGERGAFVYDGMYTFMIPAYQVRAVDPTGAGDAFTAALTARIVSGDSLEDAARYANAAGAIATTHYGAYAPTDAEIRALMAQKANEA